LQTTPGLIIDRYHGGGKADQILFRGFDSDNGTIKVNAQAPILEKHLTITIITSAPLLGLPAPSSA